MYFYKQEQIEKCVSDLLPNEVIFAMGDENKVNCASIWIRQLQENVDNLKQENQLLKDELKLERECVDFYANKESWRAVTIHQSPTMLKSDLELTDPYEDYHCRRGGKRARQRQKERRDT